MAGEQKTTFAIFEMIVPVLLFLTIGSIILVLNNNNAIEAKILKNQIETSAILLPQNSQTSIQTKEFILANKNQNSAILTIRYNADKEEEEAKSIQTQINEDIEIEQELSSNIIKIKKS